MAGENAGVFGRKCAKNRQYAQNPEDMLMSKFQRSIIILVKEAKRMLCEQEERHEEDNSRGSQRILCEIS